MRRSESVLPAGNREQKCGDERCGRFQMKSDTRELVEDLLEYLRRYHNGADTCEDNDCDGCKLVRRAEAFNIRAIRNAEAKPATERTGEPARIAQGMLYA